MFSHRKRKRLTDDLLIFYIQILNLDALLFNVIFVIKSSIYNSLYSWKKYKINQTHCLI